MNPKQALPLSERLIELALAIQQIPAPTFAEAERARFVRQMFTTEGLEDITLDEAGNVLARLPGAGKTHPLIVSAHLDTVFPIETNLSVRRDAETITAPGIGDNSLGVAGLFGLLWRLRESGSLPLPGDLWLAANVGEEGLGDLCGMKALVDRFGAQPLGYIVLEGMSFGRVYHRGLAVRRYRIAAHTAGGHSWSDYGRPSAIHELAALITRLTALPLPASPRTSLNIGVIGGGTTVNTIAAEAHLELDVRSEDALRLNALCTQVETLVAAAHPGVRFTAEVIGQRPGGQIAPEHILVQTALRSLEGLGLTPRLQIGSTDANIPLSRGLPAICVGLTNGRNAHTLEETIDLAPLEKGLEHLWQVTTGVFQTAG